MSIPTHKSMLVRDVMLPLDRFPLIGKTVILKEALDAMSEFHLGIVCIVDDAKKLLGILTDGDLRRKLLKVQKPFSAFLIDDALAHAILAPVTVKPGDSLISSVEKMGEKQIWDLPVVDEHGTLVGLLHLHQAVKTLLGIKK